MIYSIARLAVCILFLSLASYTDIKTREIKNWIWIGLSMAGITILLIQLFLDQIGLINLLGIPLMCGFAYLFFYLGMLAGADAKALMALSLAVPLWPQLGTYPVFSSVLPFPFAVFINSILLVIPLMIVFCLYNVVKGNREFPYLFFGYKVPFEKANESFVWPIESVEAGKRKIALSRNKDKNEVLKELASKGKNEVWITAELPYTVFLLIGLVISYFIGDVVGYGVLQIAG
ncbi:MAG TPA: hypothetical protein HA348_04630 [Thermoplasmata archaeon]|nr:hypothetical protein [Thermoplasmata archaeon]